MTVYIIQRVERKIKMTQEKLNEVLKEHAKWLRTRFSSKQEGHWADLSWANLRGADLSGADLRGADLSGADLSGANLRGADLRGADLRGPNLSGADLRWADLSGADLRGADLRGADLRWADLSGADLRGADLSGAKAIPHVPIVCPTHGEFIGWKKARAFNGRPVLVQLRIPEQAKRTSATGRKCRCDKAIVVGIEYMDGSTCKKAYSSYDSKFEYERGKEVSVPDFCEDRFQECAAGIHFFVDKQEAIDYEI